MENKLLHIVGGGYNQVPLVQLAKSMGLKVLVTDMNVNPPCRALADYYEQIDTTDKHNNLKAAQKYRIDAIVTDQTDVSVPTVAYIAEILKLPGIGYEKALHFTNKYLMREELKKTCPLHIPEYHFFETPLEALVFYRFHRHESEWLVKPINSQGSKGVYRIVDGREDDLISSAYLESRSRGVLLEKFLKGFEYSIEAYKEGDLIYNLALTKKYHYNSNDCIDERNTYLADIAPELEKSLFDLNEKVIRALGLPFGMTHGEYKVSGGKPYLIEIAARGGGGSISSKIIPYLTGFAPAKALLSHIFGIPHEIKIKNYKERFAILKFYNFKPGKIKKIYINRHLLQNDLLEFNLEIKEGGWIKPIKDSRDRPGYFVVHGTDRSQVLLREKQVESAVQVDYERDY